MAGSSGFHRSQTFITKVAYIKNVDIDFCAILLLGLALEVFLEVILRYVFLKPQPYGAELCTLLYTTIVLIGLSYAERQDSHVSIDFFKDKLPPRFHSFLDVVFLFLKLFVVIIIFAGTLQVLMRGGGKVTSPSMEIPLWILYIPTNFAGFGLLALTILWKIGTKFKIIGRNAIFDKSNGGH